MPSGSSHWPTTRATLSGPACHGQHLVQDVGSAAMGGRRHCLEHIEKASGYRAVMLAFSCSRGNGCSLPGPKASLYHDSGIGSSFSTFPIFTFILTGSWFCVTNTIWVILAVDNSTGQRIAPAGQRSSCGAQVNWYGSVEPHIHAAVLSFLGPARWVLRELCCGQRRVRRRDAVEEGDDGVGRQARHSQRVGPLPGGVGSCRDATAGRLPGGLRSVPEAA